MSCRDVDLKNFLERCKEEQELLLQEVKSLFRYHFQKREYLTNVLEQHRLDESKLGNGICNYVTKEVCEKNNVLMYTFQFFEAMDCGKTLWY